MTCSRHARFVDGCISCDLQEDDYLPSRLTHGDTFSPDDPAEEEAETYSRALDDYPERFYGFDPRDPGDVEYDRECARERSERR